ncbi:MAG: phage major capsid protein [Bacteroidota bacterium]|nr:phage major capsid protein [Bacteroidota bacterium]
MKKFVFLLIACFAVVLTALIGNPLELLQVGVTAMVSIAFVVPAIGTNSQSALKEAREKAQKLSVDMKSLNDASVSEKRSLTDDENVKWDKMDTDLSNVEKEIRRLERAIEIESRAGQIDNERQENREKGESRDEAGEKYSAAFRSWMMSGIDQMQPEERALLQNAEKRDLSAGTAASGGYVIPKGFMAKLEVALLAFGGIYKASNRMSTETGNEIPWPTINDTSNKGAIIGENTSVGASVDPTFGSISLKAFTYSSKPIIVSNILLQDSVFDLETYLANMMAERIWRALEEHLATGNGTTQPQGLITAAAAASLTGVGVAALTFDNLVDLLHSVDPNYRINGTWLFNDSTLKALRKIKDLEGRPIWQGNYTDNGPSMILGRPYQISQEMASIGASAKSVVFGDMSKFMVREVAGGTVKRLVERYADLNQTGFLLFKRFDARLIDAGTNPVKYLVHPAV